VTRVDDQAPPAVTLDTHVLPGWWTGHGQCVVALERLPQAAYVWDDDDPDVTWDDLTPERVWDAPFVGSGFTDVWCDLVSLEMVTGEPDDQDNFRTPYCRLVLRDPGDGRYLARTADGRLRYWSVGRRLCVWWHDEDGADWWQFAGRIATWKDPLITAEVTIEAYATIGQLASPLGRDWTVGTAGDFPQTRAAKILAVQPSYAGPVRAVAVGDVQLTVPAPSDVAQLDALRRVARSDGGIVFADSDDTVVLRDRRWRGGRPDQTTVPVLSTNVCDTGPDGIVAWDVTAADLDVRLAGRVRLTNAAGLVATATNPDIDPSVTFTHPDGDLWTTQVEGDVLAAEVARWRADARLAIGTADVHLHDIRFDYWHQALDRRIGDWVRFVDADRYSGDLYDVTLVLTTIRHTITPDAWTVQFATTPAIAYTAVELWDSTVFAWDDPSPLAVWR
jgi:hypothetical protein